MDDVEIATNDVDEHWDGAWPQPPPASDESSLSTLLASAPLEWPDVVSTVLAFKVQICCEVGKYLLLNSYITNNI